MENPFVPSSDESSKITGNDWPLRVTSKDDVVPGAREPASPNH